MHTAKHTPGPWKITNRTTNGQFVTDTVIRDSREGVIAVLHINSKANAALIADAPKLLKIVERLLIPAKEGLCNANSDANDGVEDAQATYDSYAETIQEAEDIINELKGES